VVSKGDYIITNTITMINNDNCENYEITNKNTTQMNNSLTGQQLFLLFSHDLKLSFLARD